MYFTFVQNKAPNHPSHIAFLFDFEKMKKKKILSSTDIETGFEIASHYRNFKQSFHYHRVQNRTFLCDARDSPKYQQHKYTNKKNTTFPTKQKQKQNSIEKSFICGTFRNFKTSFLPNKKCGTLHFGLNLKIGSVLEKVTIKSTNRLKYAKKTITAHREKKFDYSKLKCKQLKAYK